MKASQTETVIMLTCCALQSACYSPTGIVILFILAQFQGEVQTNLTVKRFLMCSAAGKYTFRLDASRQSTLPLLSLRDIFPRSGGSHPSRGRLQQWRQTFRHSPKAPPWGSWLCVAKTEGVSPQRLIPSLPGLPPGLRWRRQHRQLPSRPAARRWARHRPQKRRSSRSVPRRRGRCVPAPSPCRSRPDA